MSIDSIAGISGVSSQAIELLDLSSKVNELTSDVRDAANLNSKINEKSDASFFSVLKDVASQETLLITAKFGHVNIGGQVNHLNSAEDVANVLNNNQYTLVVQNTDLPTHLKEGIKAVTGGSISSVA